MNQRNANFQELVDKADKFYELDDYKNAIQYYHNAICLLPEDEKKKNHLIYFKLASSYLQQANLLMDTEINSAMENALEASVLFELATNFNRSDPYYNYYTALAKTMAVSEKLNNTNDRTLLSSALYFYTKSKDLGCAQEDLDQNIKTIQDKLDSIHLEINNNYNDEINNQANIKSKPPKTRKSVTFSQDTLFNDHKNSRKNLKRKPDSGHEYGTHKKQKK